jgi:hypothetical protein
MGAISFRVVTGSISGLVRRRNVRVDSGRLCPIASVDVRGHLIAGVLVVALIAAACGGDGPPDGQSTASGGSPLASGTLVEVDSTKSWQNTGVVLHEDQRFSVEFVGGSWTVDQRNFANVGADGYEDNVDREILEGCKVLEDEAYGSLLGRIAESEPFALALDDQLAASTSGPFFLAINDHADCLGDNAGTIEVRIRER